MSASLYEIIELPNGDVVLRRADDEGGEPMVSVRFSSESLYFLKDKSFDIAKAMIEAGMETASEIAATENADPETVERLANAFGVQLEGQAGELQDEELDDVFFELEDSARILH